MYPIALFRVPLPSLPAADHAPLLAGHQNRRHALIKAKANSDGGEGGEEGPQEEEEEEGSEGVGWCVLKGFASGDERRLRRAVGVLAGLQHRHVLPLLGVCKRQRQRGGAGGEEGEQGGQVADSTFFLQLPLLPQNLSEYMRAEAEEEKEAKGESAQEQCERRLGLLKGVLEGVCHLHQVVQTYSPSDIFHQHTHTHTRTHTHTLIHNTLSIYLSLFLSLYLALA